MAKAKAKEAESPEAPITQAKEAAQPTDDATEAMAGPTPSRSRNKLAVIGTIAIVVLLGGSVGAYVTLHKKQARNPEIEIGSDGKPIDKSTFYTLPGFIVNINSGSTRTSFLKMTIVLELARPIDIPQVEANLPRLLDTFNTYLRELHTSDIVSAAGTERLHEELLRHAEKTLNPVQINDVLFKSIQVQ